MKKAKVFRKLFVIYLMFLGIFCKGTIVNAEHIRSGDFTYWEFNDGSISISGYYGTNETVTIPSEIDGKKITGVFGIVRKNNIKHLIIEDGIINIEEDAFLACENLESVSLPDSIEKIDKSAFKDCGKLKTINIPNSVKIIEDCAFSHCKSLKSMVLTNNDASINISAFTNCTSLTIYINSDSPLMEYAKWDNMTILIYCINHPQIIKDNDPISPTCTQDGKTEGCHCPVCNYKVSSKTIKATGHSWDEGLVTQESTVQKSGTKVFTCKTCGATKTETLPTLPIPTTGKTITNTNDSYKVTKGGIKNASVEYKKPKKSKTTITIPNTVKIDGITYNVTSVSKNAFKNNKKIKKVIIGKNITKIESNAFYGCKNLKTITVKSAKIKSVGKNAFKGINSKAKIKVPASKLKKYKKLMNKKGQKKTVKITK